MFPMLLTDKEDKIITEASKLVGLRKTPFIRFVALQEAKKILKEVK